MKATFKAINASPNTMLEPVGASFLAQRRGRNKAKSSTELWESFFWTLMNYNIDLV